jgi:hypothetical protein
MGTIKSSDIYKLFKCNDLDAYFFYLEDYSEVYISSRYEHDKILLYVSNPLPDSSSFHPDTKQVDKLDIPPDVLLKYIFEERNFKTYQNPIACQQHHAMILGKIAEAGCI